MIKQKQGLAPTVALPPQFADKYNQLVPSPQKLAEMDLAESTDRLLSIQSDTGEYTRRLESLKQKELEEKEKQAALTLALETVDIAPHLSRMNREKKALSKIPLLESIELGRDSLKFRTKVLFTPIRTGDGERTNVRRCIGAFEVRIDFYDCDIYVKNLTFDNNMTRPHWSVYEGGKICQGEWETVLVGLKNDRELAALVNTMLVYLQSTDDAAAFLPSHHWLVHRNNSVRDRGGDIELLSVGDTVVMVANDYVDIGVRAVISEIHEQGNNYRLAGGKNALGGTYAISSSPWIKKESVAKITKLDYKRAVMMQSLEYVKSKIKRTGLKKREDIIKELDAAPDGLTSTQVKELF
jgi:hypothetical protein